MTYSIRSVAARPIARRWLLATGLTLGLMAAMPSAKAADDTIKVGVLHSLSGTMAISETTLKDTVLFMIDEQNKIRPHMRVFVNGEQSFDMIRPLRESDAVQIVQALSGG